MAPEKRDGYFQDRTGQWHRDRRMLEDRRLAKTKGEAKERRARGRRKADLIDVDREHKEMINEALEDFAAGEDEAE